MKEQIKDYIMTDTDGVGVYCGTYRKYNEGNLYGAWIDLEKFADADEFFDVCRELHSDEEDPEFMFQDYQGFPDDFYGESMSVGEVQAIINWLALDDDDRDMVEDYIEIYGGKLEQFDDVLDKARDKSMGRWRSFQDFADQLADEEIGCYNVPDFFKTYFDYETFARDLRYDFSEGSNGYIFRDN